MGAGLQFLFNLATTGIAMTTIKKRMLYSLFFALGAQAALAQEAVTGKWNASVNTPQGPFDLVFNLKAEGSTLSGSMANAFTGETPISEGTVDGNNLSFKLVIPAMQGGPGGNMIIHYTGSVDGDTMNLTSTVEGAPPGGGPAEQTLTATRGS